MWQVITMGLALGFVSSFHCIGMCGPLVLALPVQALPRVRAIASILLYHSGRVGTYTLLGVLFGVAGRHIFMAGLQRLISIAIGVCILLVVIAGKFARQRTGALPGFFNLLKTLMQKLWLKTSLLNFTLLGALNGLLPCGMVYFALAASLSLGSVFSSALFMFSFGAGTLVLMLALHYFGSRYITAAVRGKIRRAMPVIMAFAGLLLIIRGLNLGIPFISPNLGKSAQDVISCH